jgi:hypothetical protein
MKKEREVVETVETGDNSEKLRVMCACPHVGVVWQPLRNHRAKHAFIKTSPVYLVVEQGAIKLVCAICWFKATAPPLQYQIKES